jgi:hypothetical protein
VELLRGEGRTISEEGDLGLVEQKLNHVHPIRFLEKWGKIGGTMVMMKQEQEQEQGQGVEIEREMMIVRKLLYLPWATRTSTFHKCTAMSASPTELT